LVLWRLLLKVLIAHPVEFLVELVNAHARIDSAAGGRRRHGSSDRIREETARHRERHDGR
jgi:hypothetical protein